MPDAPSSSLPYAPPSVPTATRPGFSPLAAFTWDWRGILVQIAYRCSSAAVLVFGLIFLPQPGAFPPNLYGAVAMLAAAIGMVSAFGSWFVPPLPGRRPNSPLGATIFSAIILAAIVVGLSVRKVAVGPTVRTWLTFGMGTSDPHPVLLSLTLLALVALLLWGLLCRFYGPRRGAA